MSRKRIGRSIGGRTVSPAMSRWLSTGELPGSSDELAIQALPPIEAPRHIAPSKHARGEALGRLCLGRRLQIEDNNRIRAEVAAALGQLDAVIHVPHMLSVPYVSGHWLDKARRKERSAVTRGQQESGTLVCSGDTRELLERMRDAGRLPDAADRAQRIGNRKPIEASLAAVDSMAGDDVAWRTKLYIVAPECPATINAEMDIIQSVAGVALGVPADRLAGATPMRLMNVGYTERVLSPDEHAVIGAMVVPLSVALEPLNVYRENVR